MADYGLLGNIGKGLESLTEGFRSGYDLRSQSEAKKQALADAIKQRKLQALQLGYQENEDGTDFMKTPEAIAKQEKEDEQKRQAGLLERFKEGAAPVYDESGKMTGLISDPNSTKVKLKELENQYKTKIAETKANKPDFTPMQDWAKNERLNQNVKTFEEKTAPAAQFASQMSNIEKKLGFQLEDFDEKTGKLKKINPKTGQVELAEVDVPGVSLPIVGRTSFYSGDAKKLKTAIAPIFMEELHDKFGAAVSNREMELLKQRFGEGEFNTEEEMIGALKEMKRLGAEEIARREQGYPSEVLATFKSRGGKTSADMFPGLIGPTEANADSSGGGMTIEQKAREALKINPNNDKAKEVLRRLGVK